ncbi:MAG: MgtC/SapB family protein [Tissierellia bacterium]|nr:MgtC/SapB family protein [Tissierellia bacterium]
MRDDLLYILRILIAMFCGAIIGYERENRNKQAGLKTHVLVAMGACTAMIVSKYGFLDSEKVDASRIAAQVISGIGFLGAGVIFVKAEMAVEGLTTAAGLWATSAIAMSIGAGLYLVGIFTTIAVVTFQNITHNREFPMVATRRRELNLEVTAKNYEQIIRLERSLQKIGALFIYREIQENHSDDTTVILIMEVPEQFPFDYILEIIEEHEDISTFKFKSYLK